MFLADKDIKKIDGLIVPFEDDLLQGISYDLTIKSFHYVDDEDKDISQEYVELKPMESVFVSSKEVIDLPANLTAIVVLRNRFMRLGLHLDAPIYLPGHKTRIFFRITNLSEKIISLDITKGLASVSFQQVSSRVEKPYIGGFNDEMDFKGLGVYQNTYKGMIKGIDNKMKKLDSLEKNIYGNVMVMMTVFVALFSIINVNMNIAKECSAGMIKIIVFNLSTVGSIAALVYFLQSIMGKKHNAVLMVSAISLLIAIILAYIKF